MSELAKLLQSRGLGAANSANPQVDISEISNISRRGHEELCCSPELERRIKSMARRWRYSDTELAEVLDLARADPAAWTRAVTIDEQREAEFRERGLLSVDA